MQLFLENTHCLAVTINATLSGKHIAELSKLSQSTSGCQFNVFCHYSLGQPSHNCVSQRIYLRSTLSLQVSTVALYGLQVTLCGWWDFKIQDLTEHHSFTRLMRHQYNVGSELPTSIKSMFFLKNGVSVMLYTLTLTLNQTLNQYSF